MYIEKNSEKSIVCTNNKTSFSLDSILLSSENSKTTSTIVT